MKEIDRARVQLLLRHPFYAYLAMNLDDIEAPGVVTCAVDGKRLYYNPDFILSITPDQVVGVVAHEVLHCALQHMARRQIRGVGKWNLACDYVINLLVQQDGLQLPQGVLMDGRYMDMAEEEVYILLPDLPQDGAGDAVGAPGPWGRAPGTLDDHRVWEKAVEGDGKDAPSYNPAAWKDAVATAATVARMQGKLPSHLSKLVEDLLHPRLDWRALLQNYIQSMIRSDYRLFPANKRYLWMPLYMPSLQGESVEVVVAIDTSGSISDHEMAAFLSEVKGAVEQFEDYTIHILQCDADIQSYVELRPFDGEFPRERTGFGGTDLRPPFKWAEDRRLDVPLVYFTDGFGTFPSAAPQFPVVWVITSDVEPPFGQVIRYSREDA